MLVMFFFLFFISPRVLRGPSADRPQTWPRGRKLSEFYNPSPKIRRALPKKNLGAKNMQNFGRFYTTSEFDREYLRNGSRHQKSETQLINSNPPTLTKRNLVNFGPHTEKLQRCILTYPSGHISGHNISALKGCCALKFLHALESDQGYLAHTRTGTGVPPQKKIDRENLKFGLKFSV